MASKIMMITNTTQNVAAGGIIPLTVIARRTGRDIDGTAPTVIVNSPGYYEVNGTVTFTAPAAGNVRIAVQKNGAAVPGITATKSVATATTEISTLPITGIIRVMPFECGATISLANTDIAITASNVTFTVKEL